MKYALSVIAIVCMMLTIGTRMVEAQEDSKKSDKEDYLIAVIGEDEIYFSEIEKTASGLNRFLKENFQMSENWRLDYIRKYVARIALKKRAEREGLSEDKQVVFALKQAKINILSDKIIGDAVAKVSVGEEDIKQYYEGNKAKYQIKERVKASYIKTNNKKKAEKIITQLNKGKDFKRVASRKIVKIDKWLSPDGMMVPGLENIPADSLKELFSLGVGGTSQIIEIKDRRPKTEDQEPETEYYIFRIDEKEAAKDKPFEEVKRQVEFEYRKNVIDTAINNFIAETFSQEKVTIYDGQIIEQMKKGQEAVESDKGVE